MSKVDLHIHTSASDGRHTPAEVVFKAHGNGLSTIAITDHDTVDGIAPALLAAEAYPWLTVIAGLEINTDIPSGELHILGYFIDYSNQELNDALKILRNSRLKRAREMVEKLKKLGIFITMDRVQQIAGGAAIGRPHIAEAMLEKGYIKEFRDAFNKYISRGSPAYVERDKVTPAEAVKLISRSGGLPVLGHPFTFDNPEEMIIQLKPEGLVGIETYYDSYSAEQVNQILGWAKKYDLIPTGGSDYHGIDPAKETMMGGVDVPSESVERLITLARR